MSKVAVKFVGSESAKRKEFILISDLSTIHVDYNLRGRKFQPSREDIRSRADNIRQYGQLEPAGARKLEDGRLSLIFGYTRYEAIKLLQEEGEDVSLAIQILSNLSDVEAFERTVVENAHSNKTSHVDDAYNQQKLRDLGKNEKEIASLYGCTVSRLSQLKKILDLPENLQELVHIGRMPMHAALNLLESELTPDQQEAVIALASNSEGKVSGESVKKVIREHNAEKGKKTPRSARELRQFWQEIHESDKEDESVREFAFKILSFSQGIITPKQMLNAVHKLAGV